MALESDDMIEQLLALEREAIGLSVRVSDMERFRVPGLEQGLSQLWSLSFGQPSAAVSGQVNGCGSAGYDGAQVDIKDHATGVVIATVFADSSGAYSGSVSLTSSPQTVDVVATPTGPNAGSYSGPVTRPSVSLTTGANTVATITLLPSSSNVCICNCVSPVSKTATVVDSLGTHALISNFGGIPSVWGVDALWTVPTYTSGCILSPNQLRVRYLLSYDCTSATWTFRLTWYYRDCVGGNQYSDTFASGTAAPTMSDTIPMDCDNNTMLTFNIPTTTVGLATPGGGGTLVAVF